MKTVVLLMPTTAKITADHMSLEKMIAFSHGKI